jgi:hypothetical protein
MRDSACLLKRCRRRGRRGPARFSCACAQGAARAAGPTRVPRHARPGAAAGGSRRTLGGAARTGLAPHVLVRGVEAALLPLRHLLLRAVQLRLQLDDARVADACAPGGGAEGHRSARPWRLFHRRLSQQRRWVDSASHAAGSGPRALGPRARKAARSARTARAHPR